MAIVVLQPSVASSSVEYWPEPANVLCTKTTFDMVPVKLTAALDPLPVPTELIVIWPLCAQRHNQKWWRWSVIDRLVVTILKT